MSRALQWNLRCMPHCSHRCPRARFCNRPTCLSRRATERMPGGEGVLLTEEAVEWVASEAALVGSAGLAVAGLEAWDSAESVV